jgi:hypothetical protein
MHALGMFLVAAALLAPPEARTEPPKGAAPGAPAAQGTPAAQGASTTPAAQGGPATAPASLDPIQAMFDRLAKIGPAGQRAWLQQLEKRATRAVRMTLPPDDATGQEAKTRAQLHQAVVTWQTLREVIQDIDTREQTAIDRLVRRYRALVFDTFHKQGDAYSQRQQAWLDVYIEWKLAGKQFEQQDRLIDWLEAGIRSATPGTISPTPEKPKFEPLQPAEVASKAPATGAPPARAVSSGPPAKGTPPAGAASKPPAKDALSTGAASKPPAKGASPAEATSKLAAKDALPADASKQPTMDLSPPEMLKLPALDVPPAGTASKPATTRKPDEKAASGDDAVDKAVQDLNVRTAACNLAFRALENQLGETTGWSAARLEPLLDRLKLLVERRDELYKLREAVVDEKRASVEALMSPKSVSSPLKARIAAARKRVSGSSFQGTEDERRTELKRLDELSRRVTELEGKK